MVSPAERVVRDKIKDLGRKLGFDVEEEWSPSVLRGVSRSERYIPRIDVVWYRKANPDFQRFIRLFSDQKVLDPYKDIDKYIVVGFEVELTDRPTKYILGDISILSRLCDYGFIVITKKENLVERAKKASKAFSELHGYSNVFIIDVDDLDNIVNIVLGDRDD